MRIERLTRGEAEKAMMDWVEMCPQLPSVNTDYLILRNELKTIFQKVLDEVEEKGLKVRDYYTDAHFGIGLYTYLENKNWFSLRLAADDGFWRYMSLVVLPDVVTTRWGKENDAHFWSIHRRIWLKQIWWYIHLSWRKDKETTLRIIDNPNCSTDTILNFVERSGKKGTCVEVYRWIIYLYTIIPAAVMSAYKKKTGADLFRVVMKLNTARMMVVEPEFCAGGCKGYAKKLFKDAGFNVDSFLDV